MKKRRIEKEDGRYLVFYEFTDQDGGKSRREREKKTPDGTNTQTEAERCADGEKGGRGSDG